MEGGHNARQPLPRQLTFYLVDPEGRIAAGSVATDKIKAALEALKPTLTAATGGNAAEAGK